MKISKSKLEKPITVNVGLYHLHVVVLIGYTVNEVIAHGRRHGISKDSFTVSWCEFVQNATEGAQGYCTSFGHKNSDVLIWLKTRPRKSLEYGTLWHELSHAVDRIAVHADPGNSFNDGHGHSEPRAFLFEYLAVKITQDLWNRR